MGAAVAGDERPLSCRRLPLRRPEFRRRLLRQSQAARGTRTPTARVSISRWIRVSASERGESPDDAQARTAGFREHLLTVREVTTDMWVAVNMHLIMQDVRHAIRSLARVPGFTLIAILTLSRSASARTRPFSASSTASSSGRSHFRSPSGTRVHHEPVPRPRLRSVLGRSRAEFLEFRERNQSFQNVGAYSTGAVNVGTDASPQLRDLRARVCGILFEDDENRAP